MQDESNKFILARNGDWSRRTFFKRAGSLLLATGAASMGALSFDQVAHGATIDDGVAVIEPFPAPYTLQFDMDNESLKNSANAVVNDPNVRALCGAVVDLTGNPPQPAFYAINQGDMLYVGSLMKICAMYVAFELRGRVQAHAKAMIADGLSTSTAGWENKVYAELKKAWQPKLNAAFPRLPQGFPRLADIFVLSPDGEANFAERNPPLTDAELDAEVGGTSPEFKTPQGKFRDWMRLMLRWSNNQAASKCILALSYPYINGVLASAGFFDNASRTGLWLSGDYTGRDWLPNNRAGQQLTARWARAQGRRLTNFAATAFQVTRFMTLLGQGQLVDSASSTDMISLMSGASGIGSYIEGALTDAHPPRLFSTVNSKIGYGDDRFSHDCALVTGSPDNTLRYAVVVLGSPSAQDRADLSKLAVGFHDSILAQHP